MHVVATEDDAPPDPFWPIREGHFVLPESLGRVRSAPGRDIARAAARIDNGLRVFLRGSLLESHEPFAGADADLIVVFSDRQQLAALPKALPGGRHYDVRLLEERSGVLDPVDLALLHCRCLQVCGPALRRAPVAAGSRFAWQHWVKYCPALIPGVLDSRAPRTVTHFKLLTRCFGVLSFLLCRRFTRDISACIAFAGERSPMQAERLECMRRALEQGCAVTFDVSEINRGLHAAFDDHFDAG